MKSAISLALLLVLLFLGCSKPTHPDSAALDVLLAGTNINAIEIRSPSATNRVTGVEAQKLITSLHKTNRIDHVDETKQQGQSVGLLNGTNVVGWLWLGEDGAWEFEGYGFRTRH